jgi:nitronate monooxygenase
MTTQNRFCELVGCDVPLQSAGMSRIAGPTLAAAVSNCGAFGMVGFGRISGESLAVTLSEVARLTTRPVGATFIHRFLDRELYLVAAQQLGRVEVFYGWPDKSLVPDNAIVGWQIGSFDEGRAAVDAGCRYVIAQGIEAGGHVRGSTPLLELLDAVCAAVDVPVVAAGGIGDRREVQRAMNAGADAVRIGTRFVAALESSAHGDYVDQLINAEAADSVLTDAFEVGWPDAPHRVLASSLSNALTRMPTSLGSVRNLDGTETSLPHRSSTPPTVDTTGDIAAMALYAGRSVGAVNARQSAADIVRNLIG